MIKSKKRVFSIILALAIMASVLVSTPFTSSAAVNTGYSYLIARANSNIVSADNTGTSPLVANRTSASDWEAFKIINNSDGTISFLAQANNMYVCADLNQSSKLIARSATIGTWEKFKKVTQADGTVAFQAMANNQYVCTDLNNGAVLYANRAAVGGAWETFTIVTPGTTTPTPTPAPTTVPTPVPTPGPTTQPPAPDFGPNVFIFDPSMSASTIQSRCNTIFSQQESNQFGSTRYALLFKPGTYNVDVNVGFYTQVAGLGQSPDNTTINGAVHVEADWFNGNATCNFWRAAENLAVVPTGGTNRWAVSQAISFRRMHVKGNMVLDDGGWSSGGYLADTKVDGQVNSGSQQQWYSRNAQFGSWTGQNWNQFFQGVVNAPSGASWPNPPYTVIGQTPVIREKPFLYVDSAGNYSVLVPSLSTNSSGITWAGGSTAGTSLPISQFYIVKPGDTASTINAALGQGKNLLFTPGIYHLNDTIRVNRADTVILGLGLATLIPDNGVIAMQVADVDGVKIAGILFDAGTVNSPVLLEVGPTGSTANHSANPTSLHDVFFRVGGAGAGKAACSLKINSNNVIGDHFWVWRADHGSGVGWTTNTTTNGMIVNGQNVTIYALFVEHYHQYQTLWNGNGGRVYFYQSEIPYDVPNQSSWMNGGVNGFASYKVANTVTSHEAWGLGIYCYFSTNPSVKLNSAIEAPNNANVKFHNITTVSLGGTGEITHIVNNTGNTANSSSTVQRLVSYP